jgi:hypothetical protein
MGNSLKVASTRSTSPADSNISAHSNEFTNYNSHYSHHIPPPNAYPYYSGWPLYPQSHLPSQYLPPNPPSQYLPNAPPLQNQPLHPSYPSYPLPTLSHLNTTSNLEPTYLPDTPNNTLYNNTKLPEPSIKEFLEELDKQYGEGKYTNYLQKFEEEEITVSQIADMEPEILLNEFGVEIIGRRLNLIKEAKKFI